MDSSKVTLSSTRVPLWEGASLIERDAVSIRDHDSGTQWVVVPERVEGRPALVYLSEQSRAGQVLSRVSRLDRDQLAILALHHMERTAEDDGHVFATTRRPSGVIIRSAMPSDSELLQVIRDAVAAQGSVRRTLAEVFGITENVADKWYRYARGRPGADDLPAPRRGRPAGRKNFKSKKEES